MKKAALTALAAAALLATAACGSSSGSSASAPPSPSAAPVSLGELVQKACAGRAVEQDDPELYVREQATCGDVTVRTFGSVELQQQWLKVAQSFGGIHLVGEGPWVVDCPGQADAEQLRAVLAGRIVG